MDLFYYPVLQSSHVMDIEKILKNKKVKRKMKKMKVWVLHMKVSYSAEVTSPSKMVLGTKEVAVNLTISEHDSASGSFQHTEVMVVEQTILTKTQKRSQKKKKVNQQKKSPEPAIKEKKGRIKTLRSEVSTPSPKMARWPKRLHTEDCQLSFAHAVKAVKMAIGREALSL